MAKKEEKSAQLVSVLAFEKKIVLSDGYMYGAEWSKRKDERKPLEIREKSVRGTMSSREKNAAPGNPAAVQSRLKSANLQKVDCCYLRTGEDTLVVNFTAKFLGGLDNPASCNNERYLAAFKEVLDEYRREYGFTELAFRYAYNLASGRYLWRNRIGAEEIEVVVRDCRDGEEWTFDATTFDLRGFDESKRAELEGISKKIADAFMGIEYALFEVNCYAKVGEAQEVFPSEEMTLDQLPKGSKSKVLYAADGCAAFHSQKIGNAIRAIDTWYAEYGTETGVGPIAVDPYGPVTALSKAFRVDGKTDFYTIMDAYVWGRAIKTPEEKHFFMANIIRGGVFGESSKD